MTRIAGIVFIALGLAVGAPAQAAGNAEKGKAKAAQKIGSQEACAKCHGADGAKPDTPDNPILAGQYADFIVRALTDYKSGKRVHAVMNGVAAQLSKQDIEDLAAWFASQKSKLHFQR